MQTITTKYQSSLNSSQIKFQLNTNVQIMSRILKSVQQQYQYIQLEIQKLLPGFEIFQFLTNFSEFFSNPKFNLLYAEKQIQNMLQIYFRKKK